MPSIWPLEKKLPSIFLRNISEHLFLAWKISCRLFFLWKISCHLFLPQKISCRLFLPRKISCHLFLPQKISCCLFQPCKKTERLFHPWKIAFTCVKRMSANQSRFLLHLACHTHVHMKYNSHSSRAAIIYTSHVHSLPLQPSFSSVLCSLQLSVLLW